jgi:pSer/pThr/pTyr-binding forkhead associated (FHA) protein
LSGEATLALGPSLVIGRHPSCGIVFWDDPAVAGHHAGIHTLGDVVVLEDLGSSAGTYLNGRRMTAPAILRRGDDVQVGRRHLRVA